MLGVIVYHQKYESFKHSANCVFYKTQKRQDYGARFRGSFHHTLSFLVDLSLSYTSGAGSCSIGPQFRCKQMVEGGPASELIISFFVTSLSNSASGEIEDWDKHFALTERKLLRLFQDGKCSPSDMNARGTLLSVGLLLACKAHRLIHLQEVLLFASLPLHRECITVKVDMVSKFVKTLIRMGVPCGEPGDTGR